jgi:hypothetical protein
MTDQLTELLTRFADFERDSAMRFAKLEDMLARISPRRRGPSISTTQQLIGTVFRAYGGKCPCCIQRVILDDFGGRHQALSQFDHWWEHPGKHRPDQMWVICLRCHCDFSNGVKERRLFQSFFDSFQLRRSELYDQPLLPFRRAA